MIDTFYFRTDLAREAFEASRNVRGAESREYGKNGLRFHEVTVSTEEGARTLGKPPGKYVTADIGCVADREERAFENAVTALASELSMLLPPGSDAPVLVAGLGNRRMTPDALGALAADSVIATRHLLGASPETFAGFSPVAVFVPGVLGSTGIESGSLVSCIAAMLKPRAVIAIDALAARSTQRLCRTVQLCNSGITPGSGIGNRRSELTEKTLGVPCVAIGVPTVVDAAVLAADLLGEKLPDTEGERLSKAADGLFVTPRDIDASCALCARLIGFAINKALQPDLTVEDIELLLS